MVLVTVVLQTCRGSTRANDGYDNGPLRLGTATVSSGIYFVNTPHLYSDPATR